MISRHCPSKPSKAELIVAMHGSGKTREQIAAEVGCSIGYVTEVRRDKGLTPLRTIPARAQGALLGQNLEDPNRADKLLRRFSWESGQ